MIINEAFAIQKTLLKLLHLKKLPNHTNKHTYSFLSKKPNHSKGGWILFILSQHKEALVWIVNIVQRKKGLQVFYNSLANTMIIDFNITTSNEFTFQRRAEGNCFWGIIDMVISNGRRSSGGQRAQSYTSFLFLWCPIKLRKGWKWMAGMGSLRETMVREERGNLISLEMLILWSTN